MLFYFLFELSIFPIIFLSLIKGIQLEKIIAFNYILFYIIFFSIPFLLIIIYSKFNFIFFNFKIRITISIIIIIIFISKIPLFCLHNWLTKIHVEASTRSRIILAGLILKYGGYGYLIFLRNFDKSFLIIILRIVGLIICPFYCFFQRDLKSLIAFSSIIHINFIIININTIRILGNETRILIIISHGFISTILFFIIGELIYKNYRRLIYFIKNIFFFNIFFWLLTLISLLINIGLPLSLSFISEIIGILNLIIIRNIFWIVIIIFFMLCFIFTIFIIILIYSGKKIIIINNWNSISITIIFFYRLFFYIFI